MPADESGEFAELIQEAIEIRVKTMWLDQGVLSPTPKLPPIGNPFGEISQGTGEVGEFFIGYNSGSGTSVEPFMVDWSILYGDGTSGDTLTA